MTALAQTRLPDRAIVGGQNLSARLLRLAGWATTSLLATLGVIALFFFVLGNFTLSGTMLQLDNLASRFVEADMARRSQFKAILCSAIAIVGLLIAYFRRGSLRAAIDLAGDDA